MQGSETSPDRKKPPVPPDQRPVRPVDDPPPGRPQDQPDAPVEEPGKEKKKIVG